MKKKTDAPIVVVGAGLAGLLAARSLQAAGHTVVVLEKGRQVGGRVATRRVSLDEEQAATFDYGAQYFTVRNQRFQERVERWRAQGVVVQWSNGFVTPEASLYRDGHPRYRGHESMAAIPRYLARGLDVRLETPVAAVSHDQRWQVQTTAGQRFAAAALIMTPPVPQSLALLAHEARALPPESAELLARIDYDPCFAVMAVLAGTSAVPAPGGLWPGGEAISWMADNQQKGISAVPAITIHGSPEFSRAHFEEKLDDVARLLLEEAAPWLGNDVVSYQAKRWRYSIPVHLYHERCLALASPSPLVFAGDAFAGPRVEGAALSGLAAAEAVLRRL